jgi:hypothetical protein
VLKLKAANIGHAHGKHQARRCIWDSTPEKLMRRRKALYAQAARCDQTGERFTHGSIIVDDEDNGVGLTQAARGSVSRSWGCTQNMSGSEAPRCSCFIERVPAACPASMDRSATALSAGRVRAYITPCQGRQTFVVRPTHPLPDIRMHVRGFALMRVNSRLIAPRDPAGVSAPSWPPSHGAGQTGASRMSSACCTFVSACSERDALA